jgi:DNA polymerase-3 subunit gamma/tau
VDAIARLSAVLDESPGRGPRAEAGSAARAVAPVSPVMAALAARGGAAALRLAPEPIFEPSGASQPDVAPSGAPAMRSPQPSDPLPDVPPEPAPALRLAEPSAVLPPWEEALRAPEPPSARSNAGERFEDSGDAPGSAEPSPRPTLQAVQPAQARLLDHEDWLDLQARCALGGPVRELAAHSVFAGYDGIRLKLSLPARLEHLRMPATLEALAQKLGEALGQAPQIEFSAEQIERETLHARSARQKNERQAAAEVQFQNHPAVRRLVDQHGLRLVPDSIRPLD